jgi:hypothetical protein
MSSDLRDLIRSDLERIPLPAEQQWTAPRPRRTRMISVAALSIVIVLVVVGSLGAGQALRAIRDRMESERAAGGVLVPGDDFVYVSDGALTSPGGGTQAQAIQVVAMPAGQIFRRVVGDTYVGTPYQGGVTSLSGDWAYLPIARNNGGVGSDEYTTYLQEIDLARGFATGRIRIEVVTAPRALQTELPGTPIFPAATAVSSDGNSLWLVRDTGEQGRTTLVDRFDVQEFRKAIGQGTTEIGPLAPQAHVVLTSSGPGAVRSRVVALGADRLAVVREHFESLNRGAADWYFLDAQLRVIASYADDSEHRLPAGGECSTGLQRNPVSAGWLILCSDSSLSSDGALVFLEPDTFAVMAAVTLPRERGFSLGMAAAMDGTVYVLSDRPGVARIDARTRQTIDARLVAEARSWLDQLFPPVTAKSPGGPSVVFSPDARYAYLAGPEDAWWGSLATIDMRDAKVIAHTRAFGAVAAVGLSPGGERLYALAIDGQGVRRVVLLTPATLRFAGQSVALANDPFAIVAVRRQRPAGP